MHVSGIRVDIFSGPPLRLQRRASTHVSQPSLSLPAITTNSYSMCRCHLDTFAACVHLLLRLPLLLSPHQTTAHTICWTLFLLATHPEAESKLCAELDSLGLLATPDRPRPAPMQWEQLAQVRCYLLVGLVMRLWVGMSLLESLSKSFYSRLIAVGT
jgi:hypothetical protein